MGHQTVFRGSTPEFLQEDISARQRGNQSLPSPMCAVKGHRISPVRLPVIPLATRSKQVAFEYAKSSYPIATAVRCVGFSGESLRPRHMWICLQLSSAKGVRVERKYTTFKVAISVKLWLLKHQGSSDQQDAPF